MVGPGRLEGSGPTPPLFSFCHCFFFYLSHLKYQPAASQAEKFDFFFSHVFVTSALSLCLCASAEEVILADDDNENDYDGIGFVAPKLTHTDNTEIKCQIHKHRSHETNQICDFVTDFFFFFFGYYFYFEFFQAPAGEPQRTTRAKLSF